ncbi:uncharacterized protein LOC106648016 isoform X1 [Trichogramma pretiosum]|uniref:uncharacterized protein LOC106648016 isoform X1 n=1 Tax=Trichogramma pretiosum TaxID=7493 RepID=UPI0006C9941F|nr:uncharacterized protein LOC106648016 isoform X1 [Trichogramma pretiosum]
MAPYVAQERFHLDKTSKDKSLHIADRAEDLYVQMKRGMYIRFGQNHLMKNLSGRETLKINQTAKSKNDIGNSIVTVLPATKIKTITAHQSKQVMKYQIFKVSSAENIGFDDSFVTVRRSHLSQNFDRIREVSSNDFNKNNTILHSTSKDGRSSYQIKNDFAPNSEIDSSHKLDTLNEKSSSDTEDSLLENCQFIRNLPFMSNSSTPKNKLITKEGEEKRDVDSDNVIVASTSSKISNSFPESLNIVATGVEDNEKRKASQLIHRTIMKRKRRRKEKKNVLLKLAVALIELSLLEN